jgi:hypothetical protein
MALLNYSAVADIYLEGIQSPLIVEYPSGHPCGEVNLLVALTRKSGAGSPTCRQWHGRAASLISLVIALTMAVPPAYSSVSRVSGELADFITFSGSSESEREEKSSEDPIRLVGNDRGRRPSRNATDLKTCIRLQLIPVSIFQIDPAVLTAYRNQFASPRLSLTGRLPLRC